MISAIYKAECKLADKKKIPAVIEKKEKNFLSVQCHVQIEKMS